VLGDTKRSRAPTATRIQKLGCFCDGKRRPQAQSGNRGCMGFGSAGKPTVEPQAQPPLTTNAPVDSLGDTHAAPAMGSKSVLLPPPKRIFHPLACADISVFSVLVGHRPTSRPTFRAPHCCVLLSWHRTAFVSGNSRLYFISAFRCKADNISSFRAFPLLTRSGHRYAVAERSLWNAF
jgi:hypothetical protein